MRAAAGVIGLVAILVLSLPLPDRARGEDEPSFKGKTAETWMQLLFFKPLGKPPERDHDEVAEELVAAGADAVPVLTWILGDCRRMEIPALWASTAELLARIGPPARPAIPRIVSGLGWSTEDVRDVGRRLEASRTGVDSLVRFGEAAIPALDEILILTTEPRFAFALAAHWRITKKGEERFEKLARILRSQDACARGAAAIALQMAGPAGRSCVAALEKALPDPVPIVRIHVADALWCVTGSAEKAGPALVAELRTEPLVNVALEASRRLERIGEPAGPAIRALVEGELAAEEKPGWEPRFIVVRLAVNLLGKHPASEENTDLALSLLKSKSPHRRATGCMVLGEWERLAAKAAPALRGLAGSDEDVAVRANAAISHWRVSGEPAVAVAGLTAILAAPQEQLGLGELFGSRTVALLLLQVMGPAAKEAAPAVRRRLLDEEEHAEVRARAAIAHWRITGEADEAIGVLVEFLTKGAKGPAPLGGITTARSYALGIVTEMGPAARGAEAAVRALTKAEDAEVRSDAKKALAAILRE